MNMKILGLLAMGLLAGPMAANAFSIATAPCNSDASKMCVTSISGLVVNGSTFEVGTSFDWTDASARYFWGNDAGALAAANAIYTAVGPTTYSVDSPYGPVGNAWIISGEYDAELLTGYGAGRFSPIPNLYSLKRLGNFWTFQRTSVPEPGSLALLGLSLAGLGLNRRRKAN